MDNPKYRFWYPPAECAGCGTGLAGEEVFAQRRHQVTDILPAPEPEVTEHVAQSKRCPCCGAVTEGGLPAGVRARASYGPEAHAQAANLTCGNYVPSGRAAALMAEMAGIGVSLGWIAGVRAKAAALVESSGFMDLVRDLLRQAEAVHADETPARAAGGMRYVHLACTQWLTHMHTGDRSADAVDAGGVLPGYQGILVRDGYHQGYGHLAAALHAWCGAQYAEPGIMRNGAARGGRVACRGGARADAGRGKFRIITGSPGRPGRGQAGDTVRALCWAGSSARVPVLSAEGRVEVDLDCSQILCPFQESELRAVGASGGETCGAPVRRAHSCVVHVGRELLPGSCYVPARIPTLGLLKVPSHSAMVARSTPLRSRVIAQVWRRV